MPSTYTSNNKIQKIATGEQSGTWGNTTNTNFDLFDTAIDGFVSIALSGTTYSLNIPDGTASDARNKVISFTGTLAAANTVTVTPNTVEKLYFFQNNTTGGQNVIIAQGSGSTVTIKPGYSSIVYLDGAGSGAAVKEVLTSLKLTALLEATGVVFVGSGSGNTTLQAAASASGTLTLPAATDTLVGRSTTDTLSNKTLATPIITTNATVPLLIGGTGVTSTLTLRSTSGIGTTGSDIIFQTGTNGATEAMRISNSGSSNFGKIWTAGAQATGNATLSRGDLVAFGTSSDGAALTWDVQTTAGNASVMARLRPRWIANLGYALDVFVGAWNNAYDPGSAVATFQSQVLQVSGQGLFSSSTASFDPGDGAGPATRIGYNTAGDYGYLVSNNTGVSSKRLLVGGSTVEFFINGTERARFDSAANLKIGGTADRATTAGTNQLVIFNGTAPVGTLANGCSFYATAGEMRVMDAAGNATLLSPHDAETNEWVYDSTHTPTGKRLKINVEKLLRFVNDHFGLDCVLDEE